jgi:hypothetical protein
LLFSQRARDTFAVAGVAAASEARACPPRELGSLTPDARRRFYANAARVLDAQGVRPAFREGVTVRAIVVATLLAAAGAVLALQLLSAARVAQP